MEIILPNTVTPSSFKLQSTPYSFVDEINVMKFVSALSCNIAYPLEEKAS